MTRMQPRQHDSPLRRRSLSLAEAVISIGVVGGLLIASLNTLGASRMGRRSSSNQQLGMILAQSLMEEIRQQPYADPDNGGGSTFSYRSSGQLLELPVPGPEADELGSDRSKFDDCDDYHGWSSSPPTDNTGAQLPGADGWTRTASIKLLDPWTFGAAMFGEDAGMKLITVVATDSNGVSITLEALRTAGLEPPGATVRLLYVVTDVDFPLADEITRESLFLAWGFEVTRIACNGPSGAFTSAMNLNDAVYLSMHLSSANLGTKLQNVNIGVANEHLEQMDILGFCQSSKATTQSDVQVTDNTHYITTDLAISALTIFDSPQAVYTLFGTVSPDYAPLAYTITMGAIAYPSLVVLEAGSTAWTGSPVPGRRVQLPWGTAVFDITSLNSDGQAMMKRAIEWAAGAGDPPPAVCGDGTCDAGENACTCPDDCGLPPSFEVAGATCADGLDNDCDGSTDCADINCSTDVTCLLPGTACGNGICEVGEDCNSCSADCDSELNGNQSGRYCCGDGTLQTAEGDGSICDGNP